MKNPEFRSRMQRVESLHALKSLQKLENPAPVSENIKEFIKNADSLYSKRLMTPSISNSRKEVKKSTFQELEKNIHFYSLMIEAKSSNQVLSKSLKKLKQEGTLDLVDKHGFSLIYQICLNGNEVMLKQFLSEISKEVERNRKHKLTALSVSFRFDWCKCVLLLLKSINYPQSTLRWILKQKGGCHKCRSEISRYTKEKNLLICFICC